MSRDHQTAAAFATSWNNLPSGSVYTPAQFAEWLLPLTKSDIQGKTVLELGSGNGSLLVHLLSWGPKEVVGVDLGDSVISARQNILRAPSADRCRIEQADLVTYASEGFDVVYSIGVLHHLKNPHDGFQSVIRNTKSGGRFHIWMYAYEGNALIRYIVDPLRRITSRLPWWVTKYLIATPLVMPYFVYAKFIRWLPRWGFLKILPLYDYALWIGVRPFAFFRHVAFDQLVTPQTMYIKQSEVKRWLAETVGIDQVSTYIIFRNGNSWKFGGLKKA